MLLFYGNQSYKLLSLMNKNFDIFLKNSELFLFLKQEMHKDFKANLSVETNEEASNHKSKIRFWDTKKCGIDASNWSTLELHKYLIKSNYFIVGHRVKK